jgi:hypothetical protein
MDFIVFFIVEEIGVFAIVFPLPTVTFGIDLLGWSPFSAIILVDIGNMGLVRWGLVLLDHIHLNIGVWVSVIAYTDGVDREVLFIASSSSLFLFLIRAFIFKLPSGIFEPNQLNTLFWPRRLNTFSGGVLELSALLGWV